MMRRLILRPGTLLLLAGVAPLHAHEGGQKDLKPTKAQADLKTARQKMALAKKKLAAQGRYHCCVKPPCSLCARVSGSCSCALHVAKGLGACGECYGGWQAGRGALKGIDKKAVKLLPAEKQGWGSGEPPPELLEAAEALLRAKRILIAEKRYFCCIRGGCDQCAHEANCPCGRDLAGPTPEYFKIAGLKPPAPQRKGVCGDCLDGWRAGHGAFRGIPPDDVQLATMPSMDGGMGTANGWYASGTSLEPKASPLDMLHKQFGGWSVMLHGTVFAVESQQSGPRGRDKFFSANAFMPAASRRLGPGTLTFRSMLSLEPATITGRQYPELFQTGETAYGIPIINAQHPHNFFMELAASYRIGLTDRASIQFYGGPVADPALGPPAYPHRLSASENPMAPLGHHEQDSTHISNGVATAGFTYGPVTIEASGFNGREPGEFRWGVNPGAIQSFSARLTISPTPRWSGQFSAGRIHQREAVHPLRPTFRETASIMYVRPLAGGHWATSLIWGRNVDLAYTQTPQFNILGPLPHAAPDLRAAVSGAGSRVQARGLPATGGSGPLAGGLPPFVQPVKHIVSVPTRIPEYIYNSYLAESTLRFKDRNWIWGRVENVDKDSTLLYEEAPFVLLVDEIRFTRVQAYTAGYERELPKFASWVSAGLGSQFTYFGTPNNLRPIYGDHPFGIQTFLRFRLAPASH
jgi:hypothetical protein